MRPISTSAVRRRTAMRIGLGALLAVGCMGAPYSYADNSVPAAGAKIVAISIPSAYKVSSLIALLENTKSRGKELGLTVVIDDPGTDLNKQVNIIRTWIEQKVPVIICAAPEPKAFAGLAKQAREAGLKWVAYGEPVENQSLAIGYSQYEDGRRLGEYAGKWINDNLGGKAKVAYLGYEKAKWGQLRGGGIKKGLLDSAPDAEIVAEQEAFSSTEGLSIMRTILQAHPEINVILGLEDAATEGAYHAWIAVGNNPHNTKAFIGGMDGTPQALKLLREGGNIYRASMALPIKDVGTGFADVAAALMNGQAVTDKIFPGVLVTEKSPDAQKYLSEQGIND